MYIDNFKKQSMKPIHAGNLLCLQEDANRNSYKNVLFMKSFKINVIFDFSALVNRVHLAKYMTHECSKKTWTSLEIASKNSKECKQTKQSNFSPYSIYIDINQVVRLRVPNRKRPIVKYRNVYNAQDYSVGSVFYYASFLLILHTMP